MKARVDKGFTFLKMDFGIELLEDMEGAVVNSNFWDIGRQWTNEQLTYGGTEHPFTAVQLTPKGIDRLCEYVATVREAVGL